MDEKIGVILANTGTPAAPTRKAVKKYLSQFLMDPRICPMPRPLWWLLLHTVILRKRSRASAEKYRVIWTVSGSPLLDACDALARGLSAYYEKRGMDVVVRDAMSYGRPGFKQTVRELKEAGCTRLVVLPLYPQSAHSTTGSVADGTARAVRRARWKHPVEFIDSYGDDAVYAKAVAASIRNAGFSEERGDRLLFSYHSIPLKDIEAGDTYELQTGATSLAVAGELGLDRRRWTISYQSRFDEGRTWLAPFTRPTLVRLARAAEPGSRLFVVCPNFAVDCLETLYDVPFELEPLYRAALAGEEVDGDFEPGSLENAGRAPREGRHGAGGKRGRHGAAADERRGRHGASADERRTDDGPRRGAHRSLGPDDDFVYVPCLNKSRAHVRVLAHVLAPYVGDEA